MNQGIFKGTNCYLGILVFTDTIPNDFSIPAIHDHNGVALAGIPAEEIGHVSGPAMVQRVAYRLRRTSTRSESLEPDPHAPSVPLHDSLHLLPVHYQVHLPSQHHYDPAVPIPGIPLDQLINRMLYVLVYGWSASPSRLVLHRGPGNPGPRCNLPQAYPLPFCLQH
ncbi:MAG TPA: hypothetical protein PKM17_11870 [Syntrophorhabdus sp.]|nr:hypothetical protein [Syntrophorhabdus sp.]